MSKMGIAVLSSYRGGDEFRGDRPVARAGRRVLPRHALAHLRHRPRRASHGGCSHCTPAPGRRAASRLPVGGLYTLRRRGEVHAFDGTLIHTLQKAVETDSYQAYKRYAEAVRRLPPVALRDLLDFRSEGRTPVPLEEVESITEIRKRFVTPGMSLGALSPGGARDAVHRDEPHRRAQRLRRGRRGSRALRSPARTATTPTPRSSRSPPAASASPPNTSTTAARSRSRSPRAPSPARAASCPASR